jgi:RNA polymerase sigma-70 factor (ECF subfamily)
MDDTERGWRGMNQFHEEFVELFDRHFHRLVRYLDRLSGEPELAADLAQETFVRLYRRGSPPERPEAWLITVAMNLFRNARSKRARQEKLLRVAHEEERHHDSAPSQIDRAVEDESKRRVRSTLDQMSERDQQILLLRAEGYSYRDIAGALDLNEASVGTLLARAKRAFRELYEEKSDAP